MSYSLVSGFVVRDDGFVALAHRNANPTTYSASSTNYYVFTPRHNVSMAWVAPEHVSGALSVMARICCGQKSKKFFPSSIINVNIWEYGNRNGDTT